METQIVELPTPEELKEQFRQGLTGVADINVGEVVQDIIADVSDAWTAALFQVGVTPYYKASEAGRIVDEYVAKHYGDL